jgi:outer membrane protein assembly factor BamE (lipoprotein component of BamABCDE complex)
MGYLAQRLMLIVGLSFLLAGCAVDPAIKTWWTIKEDNFLQLRQGQATKADVRAALGEPLLETTFARQGEEVWDYRYLDGTRRMLAWVYFDMRGVYKYYTAQLDPAYYSTSDN